MLNFPRVLSFVVLVCFQLFRILYCFVNFVISLYLFCITCYKAFAFCANQNMIWFELILITVKIKKCNMHSEITGISLRWLCRLVTFPFWASAPRVERLPCPRCCSWLFSAPEACRTYGKWKFRTGCRLLHHEIYKQSGPLEWGDILSHVKRPDCLTASDSILPNSYRLFSRINSFAFIYMHMP